MVTGKHAEFVPVTEFYQARIVLHSLKDPVDPISSKLPLGNC